MCKRTKTLKFVNPVAVMMAGDVGKYDGTKVEIVGVDKWATKALREKAYTVKAEDGSKFMALARELK